MTRDASDYVSLPEVITKGLRRPSLSDRMPHKIELEWSVGGVNDFSHNYTSDMSEMRAARE